MTTARQKYAVHFCEDILHISFNGDINDNTKVSAFLRNYLNRAKYESNFIAVFYNDKKIGLAKDKEEAIKIANDYIPVTVISFRERPYIG